MPYQIEVTDTFGGDANYCWVNRETVNVPDTLQDQTKIRRFLIREAKAFAGWTGLRAEVFDFGDSYEIRPRGICQVCFVTWEDE